MAKSEGAIDYQMKSLIFILCLFLFQSSADVLAEHEAASYLKQDKAVEFVAPKGSNAPTVDPLSGIKKILYPYDTEKQLKQIHLVDRSDIISQYPCTNCHVSGKIVSTNISEENPHARIHVKHGTKKDVTCSTCHVLSDPEKLKSLDKPVPMLLAPKLCETCHSTQYKDWLQGAHGKRIGTWAGERVIYSCTQCHNPHDTEFKKTQPAKGPKVDRFNH